MKKKSKPTSHLNSRMTIKQLPQDIDAELDLLGMCFLAVKAPEIESKLFYRHKNQEVASAMQLLSAKEESLDPVNVLRELRKSDTVDNWKGKKGTLYLAEILDRSPYYSEKHERHNANQIRKTASLRKIIELMGEVIALAQEPEADAASLAAKVQDEMYGIETPRSELMPIGTVLKNVLLNLEKQMENPGSLIGITTGLKTLDNASPGGFLPGELWVVAGRPGQGKSALCWQMAVSAAKAGHKVLGVSLEMGPNELGRRFLSRQSHIPATCLRSGYKMEERLGDVFESADRLANLPIYLEEKSQINEIELQRIVSKLKPQVVFVDYLQLMNAAGKFHNRESEIAYLTRSLKNMARSFGISVVILSQLNRDLKGRANKMPLLTDLRESGSIEMNADVVLGLHCEGGSEGEADICVLKNRNGKIGNLKVYWKGPLMSFYDIASI